MTLLIGWFSTGRGPTSRKLLAAVQNEISAGGLQAQIAVVFCNRERGEDGNTDEFLDQVEGYGLPLVCLSSRDFRRDRGGKVVRKGDSLPEWRREYDSEAMRQLEQYPFDVGVLAGYMLIFTPEFAERYDLLNLHPAVPGGPRGVWQDVIWQLIESRASSAGAMMHLATAELDEGPPIAYCTFPIRGPAFDDHWHEFEVGSVDRLRAGPGENNALFAEIRRLGVARELPLVVETLRALADGRIRIEDKRVTDDKGHSIAAQDLTDEIERVVASSAL